MACLVGSLIGSVGISFPSIAERQGLPVNPKMGSGIGHAESLGIWILAVVLAGHWFGAGLALAVFLTGLGGSFVLTRLLDWHVQLVWLCGRLGRIGWVAWLAFNYVGRRWI